MAIVSLAAFCTQHAETSKKLLALCADGDHDEVAQLLNERELNVNKFSEVRSAVVVFLVVVAVCYRCCYGCCARVIVLLLLWGDIRACRRHFIVINF